MGCCMLAAWLEALVLALDERTSNFARGGGGDLALDVLLGLPAHVVSHGVGDGVLIASMRRQRTLDVLDLQSVGLAVSLDLFGVVLERLDAREEARAIVLWISVDYDLLDLLDIIPIPGATGDRRGGA